MFTRSSKQTGDVSWNGRFNGRRLPPGSYVLTMQAQDPAGNLSPPVKVAEVQLRYVLLARNRIEAKAGTRFGVRVFADRRVRWRLGARSGTAAPGLVVLRAPAKRGSYRLVVTVPGHAAAATVIVSPR